jgi:hypothetical protein
MAEFSRRLTDKNDPMYSLTRPTIAQKRKMKDLGWSITTVETEKTETLNFSVPAYKDKKIDGVVTTATQQFRDNLSMLLSDTFEGGEEAEKAKKEMRPSINRAAKVFNNALKRLESESSIVSASPQKGESAAG